MKRASTGRGQQKVTYSLKPSMKAFPKFYGKTWSLQLMSYICLHIHVYIYCIYYIYRYLFMCSCLDLYLNIHTSSSSGGSGGVTLPRRTCPPPPLCSQCICICHIYLSLSLSLSRGQASEPWTEHVDMEFGNLICIPVLLGGPQLKTKSETVFSGMLATWFIESINLGQLLLW